MGKRAKKTKVVKAKRPTIPTSFDCPFCNHSGSVDVKIDREKNTGRVNCRVCAESYQVVTNKLSEPVDVYSEWIDECEKINAS
eukprot:tig00001094_g7002.t1